MKKTRIIGATITTAMIFATFSILVASADPYLIMDYKVTPKGNMWLLSAKNAIPASFSAEELDPETIVAKFYLTQSDLVGTQVEPTRVILTKNMIILFFDTASLPEEAFKTTVYATGPGIELTASGPGFTYYSTGPL